MLFCGCFSNKFQFSLSQGYTPSSNSFFTPNSRISLRRRFACIWVATIKFIICFGYLQVFGGWRRRWWWYVLHRGLFRKQFLLSLSLFFPANNSREAPREKRGEREEKMIIIKMHEKYNFFSFFSFEWIRRRHTEVKFAKWILFSIFLLVEESDDDEIVECCSEMVSCAIYHFKHNKMWNVILFDDQASGVSNFVGFRLFAARKKIEEEWRAVPPFVRSNILNRIHHSHGSRYYNNHIMILRGSCLTTNISGFCFARPHAQLLLLHSHPEWVHFTTISVALQRWQDVFSLSSSVLLCGCRRQREFICICKQSVEGRLTISSFTLAGAHSLQYFIASTLLFALHSLGGGKGTTRNTQLRITCRSSDG